MLTIPARDHDFSPPCIFLNILYFTYKCNNFSTNNQKYFIKQRLVYLNYIGNENTSIFILSMYFYKFYCFFKPGPQYKRFCQNHKKPLSITCWLTMRGFYITYDISPFQSHRRGGGGGIGGGIGRMGRGAGISGVCGGDIG